MFGGSRARGTRTASRRRSRDRGHAVVRRRDGRRHAAGDAHGPGAVHDVPRLGRSPGHPSRPRARHAAGPARSPSTKGSSRWRRPARRVAGPGAWSRRPCPTCAGAGAAATYPHDPGEDAGRRARTARASGWRARASPAARAAPPGDLFVRVHVRPHPLFGRRGDDLTLELPVTFPEAALGANVEVPTLNGPVTLKVPAGTASGKTFRVRGKGVAEEEGRPRRPAGHRGGRRARQAVAGAEEAGGAVA